MSWTEGGCFMRIRSIFPILGFLGFLGCVMIGSWKAIPPPGGCEQCHRKQITHDWTVAYMPAQINDETGRYVWQEEASILPPQPSPLEQQKVTEEKCFRCHKSPDKTHKEYRGRYHHKRFF